MPQLHVLLDYGADVESSWSRQESTGDKRNSIDRLQSISSGSASGQLHGSGQEVGRAPHTCLGIDQRIFVLKADRSVEAMLSERLHEAIPPLGRAAVADRGEQP